MIDLDFELERMRTQHKEWMDEVDRKRKWYSFYYFLAVCFGFSIGMFF